MSLAVCLLVCLSVTMGEAVWNGYRLLSMLGIFLTMFVPVQRRFTGFYDFACENDRQAI